MAIEIEKKAWINNLDKINERAAEIAKFVHEEKKYDTYYYSGKNIENIDFKNDTIFRIRKNSNGSFITLKEREFHGKTEINVEKEFEIINPDELEDLFKYMGYSILVKKNKISKVYKYKEASIEVNTIEGLGDFIEVEVVIDNEKNKDKAFKLVDEIFSLFDINEKLIEDRYYIDLLLQKNKKDK